MLEIAHGDGGWDIWYGTKVVAHSRTKRGAAEIVRVWTDLGVTNHDDYQRANRERHERNGTFVSLRDMTTYGPMGRAVSR
jgi:hypothetical protein